MMADAHSYLSAAVAVTIGALFAGVYTSYLNHLASKNDILKDYLRDLSEIERLAEIYWLAEPENESDIRFHDSAGHKLRAKMEATSEYSGVTKSILGDAYERFEGLDTDLFVTVTGGTFQTAKFGRDPQRYSETIAIVNKMRSLLRHRRNTMFWAG
ncbi:hypothetical protein KUV62_22575 [Salipiger bermudensis]|uniref:hypothetical protein n=1 Tax=Salipiger bermudensis TaxID=344736 RepID=UPI001C9A096C|nr:hypothetical protein [Salipiger bermudensis]MBY6006719.1 hypothetical protein [Salipiger bermudensis]